MSALRGSRALRLAVRFYATAGAETTVILPAITKPGTVQVILEAEGHH